MSRVIKGKTFSEWLASASLDENELCGGALDDYRKAWETMLSPSDVGKKYLSKVLADIGFVVSTAEARRLISGGIIYVDGVLQKDPMYQLKGAHRLERRGRLMRDEEVIV